jgi:RNA polymerase sigma-70 factor (ECF subfamily)
MHRDPGHDRQAFLEASFEENAPGLYLYLHRLIGDEHEAESLTQECFLRLCRSDATFPHGGALRAWLYRVARNLVFDRQKRRGPRLLEEEARELALTERPDEGPGPVEALERRDDAQRMRAALSRLPLLYQSTLALRFLDEWSYERIAELEEVSVSALRSRIHKGLQLLRSELQELADGEGPASLEGSHD